MGAGLVLVHVQVESSGGASRLVVVHGRFSEFAGPERFRPYFADLLGRPGVIRSDVRTHSARADKKAEREGLGLRVHDVPTGTPGEYWLVVEAEDLARWHPVGASFAAGNYGTRYAGRDLGYANVRLNPGGGTQVDMQFTKHIDNQSKNVEGADYTQGGLGTSVATPWGIYGLNGAVTEYQTGVDQRLTLPETTEGYIRQFGVWGEQLLYASRRVTWSVTESANHARNRVELPDDIRLFEQNYTLASLASTVVVEPSWEPEATLNVRLWVAQGLGGTFDRIRPPDIVTDAVEVGGAAELNLADTILVGGGGRAGASCDLDACPIALSPNIASGGAIRTPKEDFTLMGLSIDYRHPLPSNFEVLVAFNSQFTDDTMPELEQFVLGGFGKLSSWLPGVAEGDRGGLMRLVLSHSGPNLGVLGLGLSGYVEGGATEFARPFPGAEGWNTLADAGIAITAQTSFGTKLTLAYAEHIGSGKVPSRVREAERADVYFQLEQRF